MTGVCMNHFLNTYVLRHEARVLKFHAFSSLAAPPHVQVSTRKRRKSDGESWIECERKIVRGAQQMQ
jgi:hypothetical protein